MNYTSEFINYLQFPSLKQLTCIKTACCLWVHPSVTVMIKNECFVAVTTATFEKKLNLLHQTVNTHLLRLPLPEHLKCLVSNYLKPIGRQLVAWIAKRNHLPDWLDEEFLNVFHSIAKINSIHWTADGIIHQAKTYEAILSNINSNEFNFEHFGKNFQNTFKALCNCCLEDYIFKFWAVMPKETRKYFSFEDVNVEYENHFIVYWISVLKKDQFDFIEKYEKPYFIVKYDSKHSVYKNMVTLSIALGNVYAFKYFWGKLVREEIESFLSMWVGESTIQAKIYEDYYPLGFSGEYSILFFLLSQLTPEKQRAALTTYAAKILYGLNLLWPWSELYLRTLEIVINDSDSSSWCKLMKMFCRSNSRPGLARDIIQRSPVHFHKSFMDCIISDRRGDILFWNIFAKQGIEVLKVFVDHVNVEEKKRMIVAFMTKETDFNFLPSHFFERWKCLLNEQFYSIDQLFLYMGLDEEECRQLRFETVKLYVSRMSYDWIVQSKWNAMDNFLNWGCNSQQALIQDVKKNMDKNAIFWRLMREENVEPIDKFLNWCFSSVEDILDFKRNCAYSVEGTISALQLLKGSNKSPDRWDRFQRHVFWCLPSDEEIGKFQVFLTQNCELPRLIYYLILFEHAFDLCDKVLLWCLKADEKVRVYKEVFLSVYGTSFFCEFALNQNGRCNNYKHLRYLSKWFHPISIEISNEFKNDLAEKIKTDQNSIPGHFFIAAGEVPFILHLLDIFATDIYDDSKSGDINRYVTNINREVMWESYFMHDTTNLISTDNDIFNGFLRKILNYDDNKGR